MSRTYATVDEFTTWLNTEPLPEGAARLLRDASLEVDEMLLTAHYRVDHDGMPTDPKVVAALRDATCAQADYRDEHGDEATIIQGDETLSLGILSLGGRKSGASKESGLPQHSPEAVRILRLAGLIPGGISDG